MNKTAIKNFAIWARRKLISEITYKAGLIGINENNIAQPLQMSTENVQFFDIGTGKPTEISNDEIKQRNALIKRIKDKESTSDYKTAFQFVIEEVAYTWFNRLVAIRFMEVNDYLPSRIRVLSSSAQGKAEPDMVTMAFDLVDSWECGVGSGQWTVDSKEKVGSGQWTVDRKTIQKLKDENRLDELFRIMFIAQCNKLNEVLPELFEKTADYTEFLLSISFTDSDGIVSHLVNDIAEEDFTEAVEIIGWLYQYYNTEPKDEVFSLLKKNVKITKERIPAATQLFTPDWIVRYMVENSLGRLWVERIVGSEQWAVDSEQELKKNWKYYLEEAEQEGEVKKELEKIREEYKKLSLEDIKVIDPCMGSGHILVYAFDVLMQIYESMGYTQRDAAQAIIENNLYGLDIDDRAYQLAYFAVMMKARKYNRRFLTKGISPKLYSIKESNNISKEHLEYFGNLSSAMERNTAIQQMEYLMDTYRDAKEYGSILNVDSCNWNLLNRFVDDFSVDGQMSLDSFGAEQSQEILKEIIVIGEAMAQKYDVVVTNPPYMGGSGMGANLSDYVKKNYPDSKSDLFAVFIEKCGNMLKMNGLQAMITQHSWMFLSSYEKLRAKLLLKDIVNMAHLGARAFEEIGGEVVQTTAFVLRNSNTKDYKSTFIRLINFNNQQAKEDAFLNGENIYIAQQENFEKIPGMTIAYWISKNISNVFSWQSIYELSFSTSQNKTGNNDKFLRKHWEINNNKFGKDQWIFYAKGGEYRRWWGNLIEMINWTPEARYIYQFGDGKHASQIIKSDFWYKKGITWGIIAQTSFRILPEYATFDMQGSSVFINSEDDFLCIIGYLNTKVAQTMLKILNTTLALQVRDVRNLPYDKNHILPYKTKIDGLVSNSIDISKKDWDSFETSWDFKRHLLVRLCHGLTGKDGHEIAYIEDSFVEWESNCNDNFNKLKANEEELNRIFIEIYGLQDELTPEVAEKDITIRKADLVRDIKSLISYAVGCMLGRYSLDVEGLAYAGGDFSEQWAVVSGQYYLKEVLRGYGCYELSRYDCMAEVNEACEGDISVSKKITERGKVCSVRSNEESSGFDSIEHSGRASTQLDEGVCSVSVDSAGFESRATNSNADLCRTRIPCRYGYFGSDEINRGNQQNVGCHYSKTDHCPLTTAHFHVDKDNCIPITDEEYFEDDIVGRFVEFVKCVYGAETLEENLDFIAKALGNKGDTSREIIRNYFIKDFYKDHVKTYQKRPIYWLYDSGKQDGFKALVYMHRYTADTTGIVRVDYLHKMQRIYMSEIDRMQDMAENSNDTREVARAEKRREKLVKQLKETKEYDEKIAHLALSRIEIDLDDGVKVNYEKVQTAKDGKKLDVLGKI